MNLLIVNPNITPGVTTLIEAEACRVAHADTHIEMATAASGVAYIETRFEALLGAYAAATIAGERYGRYDALMVAAFGDPGLLELREVLDVPVVGMTEAALMTAGQMGQRIGIIAISRRITAWYRECVDRYGMLGRLAGIRHLDRPLRDPSTVQQDHGARLVELSREAVEQDGADVLILAGAPLAGLARGVAGELSVPVVDGVSSAVCQAETLARLKPIQPTAGSFAKPPAKPRVGLPESGIGRLLAR
ncbi:aspartate/glutamate racemase family protein [Paraburkholderia silvatlantica]|uniref:Asp/Glu/hydantoin racemase n=1 Tax=Paraburkholderia silvatlantica TaxID=321895 RepID=A0A2U1A9M5_9BURK|nr:aspartate/glutamate racemase family protein [Paraburkholderia silvatlantica]MBB2930554.1 Asp/Glu/hydantoin racemase [Paraburkholderia silvatlantica]PVY30358.1 Asp/Glu/hydantoin racemase [Paraburkholderia silvatlantica]PXW36905.1 Asp/Glu/hydantoin racemase [Paraburkholderia silvatlantica]PYE21245.1 Asp/Glu/hydantoin racemase [Paraburkholderia silvatlantica]TDQ86614.1 Asp/Glu/hydantoin racemase [Paraburkholderia silvatlantica]